MVAWKTVCVSERWLLLKWKTAMRQEMVKAKRMARGQMGCGRIKMKLEEERTGGCLCVRSWMRAARAPRRS